MNHKSVVGRLLLAPEMNDNKSANANPDIVHVFGAKNGS